MVIQIGGEPWVLKEDKSRIIIKHVLYLGINFFDTANIYSRGERERILGRALKNYTNRKEIVVASKRYFETNDGWNVRKLSHKALMNQIDDTLERLGIDYVDLYIIHRWDYNTPIEETMEALHDIVKSEKYDILEHQPCIYGNFKRGNI